MLMRRWVHWDTLGRRGQLSTVHGSTRMPMQGSFEVFFALIGHVYLFVWQRYDVTTSLSEAVKRNFLTCWLTKLKLNFRLLSWWRRLGKKKGIQLVLFGNPAQLDYFLKRMLIEQKKWKWLRMKLKIRRQWLLKTINVSNQHDGILVGVRKLCEWICEIEGT